MVISAKKFFDKLKLAEDISFNLSLIRIQM